MIDLTGPYRVVAGYTLLRDHADPSIWYVIPRSPQLRTEGDGRPALSLVQYLGGNTVANKVAGGLLTLTTTLQPEPAVLTMLESKLDEDSVHLVPVPFDEGTVELVALGSDNANAARPFNVRILGSGKPSLGGDNAASFQLVIDAGAAELVESLLDQPALPVIAIYHLKFTGLRPSFNIHIQADWNKVYESLKQRLTANAYYAAVDVDSHIENALETDGMDIDTVVLGAGDGDRGAAEQARRQLLDWVLDRMFEPLFPEQPNTGEVVAETVDSVVSSLVRAVVPGVTYRLRQLTQTQLRSLDVRMDEAVAERRELVPQGTLGAMLNRFRVDDNGEQRPDWPEVRDAIVQKVNLDGFPRLEVTVGVEDRFASDGVQSVEVELARQRGEDLINRRSFLFRNGSDQHAYVVNLLGTHNPFLEPYRFRSQVTFAPGSEFGAHPPLQTSWRPGRTSELFVEPRDAYSVESVTVAPPPTFSFVQYSAVTVELKYKDQVAQLVFRDTQPQSWRFRHFEAALPPYDYRITYHRPVGAANPDVQTSWQTVAVDLLSLPDPMPRKRPLDLFVNLPWDELVTAFVDVHYEDKAHDIRYDEQLDLSSDQRHLHRDYPISEDGPLDLDYRLTAFFNDGTLLAGSWRTTTDSRVVIDRALVERKELIVRTVGGALDGNGLARVTLELQHRDTDGTSVRDQHELRWDAGQAAAGAQHWEFPLGDPPVKTVHFRTTFTDLQGFVERGPWHSTDNHLLVVDLRNRRVVV